MTYLLQTSVSALGIELIKLVSKILAKCSLVRFKDLLINAITLSTSRGFDNSVIGLIYTEVIHHILNPKQRLLVKGGSEAIN